MTRYYIYHVPGIKIGCTSQIEKRMSDQGFTSWEILEEHTDIYEVSNREIQLQKEYGYTVDNIPYWKSVENRIAPKEASSRGGITQGAINKANNHFSKIKTKESLSKGGKTSGKMKRTLNFEVAQEIRSRYIKRWGILKELSEEYGVSKNVICGIVYNTTYLEP